MLAARLTEQVTLIKPTVTIDNYGAEKTTWTDVKTVRAEVQWKSGSTVNSDDEMFEQRRVDILIRWREVDAYWRVRHNGVLYNISAIEPNRRLRFKRLICDRTNE